MAIAGVGTAALALGALTTVGKAVYGMSQNSQAADIEANNKRPVQGVNPIYQDNVNQAGIMAQAGTPTQEYNIAQQNIQRNLNGGLSALTGGSNPAGVISLVRAANDASGNIDANSAEARQRNLMNLMQQRSILAQQQQKAFEYNDQDKYSENLAKSQALRGAGAQNISGAFNDATLLGETALLGQQPNTSNALPATYGEKYGTQNIEQMLPSLSQTQSPLSRLAGYIDTPVNPNYKYKNLA